MSDSQFQVHFAIEDIPAVEWNHLASQYGLYFTHEWQLFNDHFIKMMGKHPYVFSLRQGGRIVALALGYAPDANSPMYYPPNVLFNEEFLRMTPGSADEKWAQIESVLHDIDPATAHLQKAAALQQLYKRFEQEMTPCLVLSFAFTSQVLVDPAVSADDAALYRAEMLEGIETFAKENGFRSLAFLYGVEEEVPNFRERGYQSSLLTALAYLDTSGMSCFDDYLAALPGPRRTPVRHEIKQLLEKGYEQAHEPMEEAVDEVAVLEFNLLNKYGKPRSILGIYEEKMTLDELFGEQVKVLTLRQDGQMAASSVYMQYGEQLYVLSVGFDYELTEGSFAYPHLVFYHPIRTAIEQGVRFVDLGIESFRAKLHRGAQLAPRHVSVLPFTATGRDLLDKWLPLFNRYQEDYFGGLKPYQMNAPVHS